MPTNVKSGSLLLTLPKELLAVKNSFAIAIFVLLRAKADQISHICDGAMQCRLINFSSEKRNMSTFLFLFLF